VITNAEKVERYYFDTHVLDPVFYRPLLLEGLAQARHTWRPEVSIHRRLKPLVEDLLDETFEPGFRILAQPDAHADLLSLVQTERPDHVLLAVGPEGGWTAYEEALLSGHGFTPAGIGPRTLRSDTACVALLSILNAAMSCR
jgi:RsmE family RNA methyltransferase